MVSGLSYSNKKKLENLSYDITDGSDFFIVKICKLFFALFVAIGNIHYDNEIEKLQEANKKLKDQARKILAHSQDVSAVLRNQDFDVLETTLFEYENSLNTAKSFVENVAKDIGLSVDEQISK